MLVSNNSLVNWRLAGWKGMGEIADLTCVSEVQSSAPSSFTAAGKNPAVPSSNSRLSLWAEGMGRVMTNAEAKSFCFASL